MNANTVSKIMSRAMRVKIGDMRIVRIEHVLGLRPGECFVEEQKALPETDSGTNAVFC